jgi:hypothetical protein
MLESSKDMGKYEEPLLRAVERFFVKRGYFVSSHVRLNVAWSNVISDIDVIAKSADECIIIEVKSDHDQFYRAFDQLQKLRGFADRLYIATNRPLDSIKEEKWLDKSVGLIHIDDDQTVQIVKPAPKVPCYSLDGTLSQLKKKCLVQLATLLGVRTRTSKSEIEKKLTGNFSSSDLKVVTKYIVMCEHGCTESCILSPVLEASCISLREAKTDSQSA